MKVLLLNDDQKVKRTLGRVSSVITNSNGDLTVTFEDSSWVEVKQEYFNCFITEDEK